MKILALSKYAQKGASSRYRFFQYYPALRAQSVEIQENSLFSDEYLDALYSRRNRIGNILKGYLRRTWFLLSRPSSELVWLEKELFPWVPWIIERFFMWLLKSPYVVDYDDAVFHRYDLHRSTFIRILLGRKCDRIMRNAAAVVAGNEYLAERARRAGAKRVIVIPTVVSGSKFFPKEITHEVAVIGWIGSMSTALYLEQLRPVLSELRKKHEFVFRVVGTHLDWFDFTVQNIPWSAEDEVSLIQSFDIGVMPLLDSPWERGKCGFKLIQYMACGKAVIADPIGVNSEIVEHGINGYLASDARTWYNAIEALLLEPERMREFGRRGREKFEKEYSLERWHQPLFELFKLVISRSAPLRKYPNA